jgi:hypothetical protein
MSITILQDGRGRGPAEVSDGDLHTKAKCRTMTVYQTQVQATTTAATVLAARTGRNGLSISVLGPSPVHLSLDGSTPNGTYFVLEPGATWTFPACNTYAGDIKAVTMSGTCDLSFLEFAP